MMVCILKKAKSTKKNSIYSLGKEFVFNIKITENDSTMFLKENNHDDFKLSNSIDSLKISEIHLTVIKPRVFKRTNKNQTEVYYSCEPNPKIVSATGIVETQKTYGFIHLEMAFLNHWKLALSHMPNSINLLVIDGLIV
jgi:hypothetical protein